MELGQSLSFFDEENGSVRVELEEVVYCPTCGESLTEARIALMDLIASHCPICSQLIDA